MSASWKIVRQKAANSGHITDRTAFSRAVVLGDRAASGSIL
jgi:hypothetical protein